MQPLSYNHMPQQSKPSTADADGCEREQVIAASVDSRCPRCRMDQAKPIYIITHKLLDKVQRGVFSPHPVTAEINIPLCACV